MPPCGYNPETVAAQVSVAQLLLNDLCSEVEAGKHSDLPAGIRKELDSLRKARTQPTTPSLDKPSIRGALAFAEGLYEELVAQPNLDSDPEVVVNTVLENLGSDLTRVHINEASQVVERT